MTTKIIWDRRDRYDFIGPFVDRPTTAREGSTFYDETNLILYIYGSTGWFIHPNYRKTIVSLPNVTLEALPTANLYPVRIHTIAITIVNAAAAQTDTIVIDGEICTFTSDATPTTTEISTGLRAAIAASKAVGKFVVTGTTNVVLTPAYAYSPEVTVSANLTDVQTFGSSTLLGVKAQLGAGESYVGQTGGYSKIVKVTPTITVGAYSAQDMVGGKLTLTDAMRVVGGKGYLYALEVIDTDKIGAALYIHLYSAMAGTYADNDAEAISAADALNHLGIISILTTDYIALANFKIAAPAPSTFNPIMLESAAASRDIFAIVVCVGTPTYTHTNGLLFKFGIIGD